MRGVVAVMIVMLGWPAAAGAAGPAPPQGVTAQQARDLADLLNDPVRRQHLIDDLRALEKVAPAGVPAPAPTSTATPSAGAETVPATGLVSRVAAAVPGWTDRMLGQLASLRDLVRSLPRAGRWIAGTAADAAARRYLLHAGFNVVLVVVIAAIALFASRRLLKPARAGLIAAAGRHPHPAAAGSHPARTLRRFSIALTALLLDLVPVGLFAVVGFILAPVITRSDTTEAIVGYALTACIAVTGLRGIARGLAAPNAPSLRLIPMANPSAVAAVRWVGRLAGIAAFGMALLAAAGQLGLDQPAQLALQKLVLLIDHVLLVAIVLRNRHAVAARLRALRHGDGAAAEVLAGLAGTWHIIAIFVISALWLIWAAGWQGGYLWLVRFVAAAIAVGAVTGLLTDVLLAAIRHLLHLPDPTAPAAAPEAGRPARAAYYYPVLRLALTVMTAIIGFVVLLEFTGFAAFGWLVGTAIGRQVIIAFVSIGITLGIAVIAWEAVNAAIDRHLDRLSGQAQLARATRLRTLLPIIRTTLAGTILVLIALTILSQIGVNIAPLLAGAGIVGVAIGFGSQKLVQDLITGIFLLLENAMQVGDFVTLAGVSGVVETLSIRTIRLRAGDGSVHIIPFSSVTMVNNTNRGLGNAAISVTVGAREDTDAVGEVMKAIVAEMREDPAFKDSMLSDLQLWGVDQVDGVSAVLVGQIVCTDAGRWGVQREFNRRYKKRFEAIGIEIPMPTQTLLIRRAAPPTPHAAGTRETAATTVTKSPPSSSLGHTE